MSLTVCLACGTDVQQRAATCPGCGTHRGVDNTLARRSFLLAAALGAVAVAAPFLLAADTPWIKPLSILVLALVTASMIWIIPAIVEGKQRQNRSSHSGTSREHVPTRYPR